MKKELIKFIEEETGFRRHPITDAIKKYFKGLEVEWQEKKENIYIHDIDKLTSAYNALYIEGKFGKVIWNNETLFMILPRIIEMVYEQRIETDKRVKEQIEEITRLITI